MSLRIGLFSGTFDPMHIGHVEACLSAKGAARLDKILVLIEKQPHRKQAVTPFEQRHAMVELALSEYKSIALQPHPESNITFDNTLPMLRQKFPNDDFFYIVGSDMLKHLMDWPDVDRYLPELHLLVVLRDNQHEQQAEAAVQPLPLKSYKILPAVWSPVSSSMVRQQIAQTGESDLVHPEVLAYIKQQRLYEAR